MSINIDIPSQVELALRSQFGLDLEERAKQDLAAAWFSEGRISSRQVAEMLGISLFEAHRFLKDHGAFLPMELSEVLSDLDTLRAARGS
jgi:predicted HTH domain antitoxin